MCVKERELHPTINAVPLYAEWTEALGMGVNDSHMNPIPADIMDTMIRIKAVGSVINHDLHVSMIRWNG